jgi:type IV secretion system protein VirD4
VLVIAVVIQREKGGEAATTPQATQYRRTLSYAMAAYGIHGAARERQTLLSWLGDSPRAVGSRGWVPTAAPRSTRPLVDPEWDRLLLVGVVAVAGVVIVVLATGHVSALAADGSWPHYPADAIPGLLWDVAAHPGDPGRAWDSVSTGGGRPPGPVAWWTVFGLLVAAVGAPIGLAAQQHRHRGRHGAHWAGARHIRRLRVGAHWKRGRLVVGRVGRSLVAVEARHSLLVFGPTQSGKTTGLAIPALLEWPGPIVATSTKTDLVDDTIGWRSRVGPVQIFDPAHSTSLRGSGWSPLATADTWRGACRAGWDLAMAGKAAVGGSMSLADFWFSSAAKSLAPYLLAAAHEGRSIADVARWIDAEERTDVLAIVRRLNGDAALAHQATFRREERARSSLFQVMQQILAAYLDPVVAASADSAEIDAADLVNGSVSTLYLTSPYLDQARLRPLFSTVVRQVITAAYEHAAATGRPLDPPLLLVLDEAANIAPVDDLATVASTSAAIGVQLVTVFQDLAQVRSRYGDTTGTVINNHRATLFLPGIKDLETLDLTSRLIGEQEVDRESVTQGTDGRRSSTTATQWRRLLPGEAARTLPAGHGVLVYDNLPPIHLRLRPWFRNRPLRRRAATEPAELLSAEPVPTVPSLEPIGQTPAPATPAAAPLPSGVSILDVTRARLRARTDEGGE